MSGDKPNYEEKYVTYNNAEQQRVRALTDTTLISYTQLPWSIQQDRASNVFLSFLKALFPQQNKGITEALSTAYMTSVLDRYLPANIKKVTVQAETPVTYNSLLQQIEQSSKIAHALKNIWWFRRSQDKDVSQATRLLLCRQMLDQFKDQANDPEAKLSETDINNIYQLLQKNFKGQREWFGGQFNKEMDKLQHELISAKQNYLWTRTIKSIAIKVSHRYQGSFTDETLLPAILKAVPLQLDQIERDLQQLSRAEESPAFISATLQSSFKNGNHELQLKIANFIASDQCALKYYLNRTSKRIRENSLSNEQLAEVYQELISLSTQCNPMLLAIKRINHAFLDKPVSDLIEQINQLATLVESQVRELNKKNAGERLTSLRGKELKSPAGVSSTATLLELTASGTPGEVAFSASDSSAVVAFAPLFSKKEAKKDNDPHQDAQRIRATDSIAYEAKRYIKTKLANLLTGEAKLDGLFTEVLNRFENLEPELPYDQAAKEMQKIMKSLNDADARKVVALLSIYTQSEKYQRCHPLDIATREKIFTSLQDRITTAMADLRDYGTKYDSPQAYCASLAAVGIIGEVYKRGPYEKVFTQYEGQANKLIAEISRALDSLFTLPRAVA